MKLPCKLAAIFNSFGVRSRVIAVALSLFLAQRALPEDTPAIAAFKSFLENSPPQGAVVFQRQYLSMPRTSKGAPTPPPDLTNRVSTFVGAWRTNGFLLRQKYDLSDEDFGTLGPAGSNPAYLFAGIDDGIPWNIVTTNISKSLDKERGSREDVVSGFSRGAEGVFAEILNLGIINLKPGSLKWSGDSLVAESQNGELIEGNLLKSSGLPGELQLAYKGSPRFLVKYDYLNGKPHHPLGIPDKMVLYAQSPEKKASLDVPRWQVTIVSVSVPNENAPTESIAPEVFLPERYRSVTVVSNGAYFALIDGKLYPKRKPTEIPAQVSPRGKSGRFLITLLLGCILLAPLLYVVLRKNKIKAANG
jgi:hypothetical protein